MYKSLHGLCRKQESRKSDLKKQAVKTFLVHHDGFEAVRFWESTGACLMRMLIDSES